jgi:hypothetical protein
MDYALVLTHHPDYAGRLWGITDNDYSSLVMGDDGPKPTKKSLEDRWPTVEHNLNLARIRAERAARYNAETDPIYMKVQRDEDGYTLDDWKAAVAQIKADLPYPEEPK